MIPRFQGNALQDKDGWYWEMFVSIFGGGQEAEMFSTTCRFKTKDEALNDLIQAVQSCVKSMAESHPELNINTDFMYDLKNNEKLSFNKDGYN